MLTRDLLSLAVFGSVFGHYSIWADARAFEQQPIVLPNDQKHEDYTRFDYPIKRVAVIGAGPSGLQSAATLREHGFQVRLFDRSSEPGGNWHFSERKPIKAYFPDIPIDVAGYTPDIPKTLPLVHVYEDGEGGVSNDWRLREHLNPSPVWKNLRSNSAPVFTTLPDITYPPDAEWALLQQNIQRHVRQFASYRGLNSNDEESRNITSYSTRVEQLRKSEDGRYWNLTLRKLEELPYSGGRVRAEWWVEQFDAVVVATGPYDATHVPPIKNLDSWAHAFPEKIYHSREYRHPEDLSKKNVLIVGGSISASEIARDIAPHVKSFSISIRNHDEVPSYSRRRSIRRLPANITRIPEIESFSTLDAESLSRGVRGALITLKNGTVVDEFDEIIFATGYRRSNPFLVDLRNSTIVGGDEPEVKVAPIITDGSHLRSLHWTGHYISDPTLAFTTVRAWTMGQYQSLAFAKVWSGKARIPSEEKLWAEYPGAKRSLFSGAFGSLGEEALNRQWVAWLNNASLEFGGRFVSPWSIRGRETFVYYAEQAWEPGYTTSANFTEWENIPRDQWTVEPRPEAQDYSEDYWEEEDW